MIKNDWIRIPEDYSCESCNSKNGKWIYDKMGSGVAIVCQCCGEKAERLRHWRDELGDLRKEQTEEEIKEKLKEFKVTAILHPEEGTKPLEAEKKDDEHMPQM